MELSLILKLFFSMALLGVCSLFTYVYNVLWMKPQRFRSMLERQGIGGPPPSFLYGNIPEMKRIQSMAIKSPREEHVSHDWASTVFPYFELWRNKYGPIFMYSTGSIQLLYVTNHNVVKEISLSTSLDLGKPSYLLRERGPLFGQGILVSNGAMWAHQRKIIAPELYPEKVKCMVNLMVESAVSLVKSWESRIASEGGVADIRVDEDLRSLSADIISKACFGSSFSKGKGIFLRLRALQKVMSTRSLLIGIPGLRYIPSKYNREIWRLEKEIYSLILNVARERKEAGYEKDLLQVLLESTKNHDPRPDAADRFIVDNCKNIYFAGHETTAVSASWTIMLLASNPEWQARVRTEVVDVYDGDPPKADMLRKMKTLTMVIHEALRLYPPAAFVTREALQDMKFGDLNVPKGVNLWIPVQTMHQDPQIWGPDAHKFNPERFASGIFGACKVPQAYMPFGIGTRICAGQNFAMIELKIVLSLILSNFSFSISPKYHHSPTFRLVIEPEHGVDLLIRRVV